MVTAGEKEGCGPMLPIYKDDAVAGHTYRGRSVDASERRQVRVVVRNIVAACEDFQIRRLP